MQPRRSWATKSIPKCLSQARTKPMVSDPAELILNRTWRPQLAVTAMDGYPLPENGGNVLLPYTTAKLVLAPAADMRCGQGDHRDQKRTGKERALWRGSRVRCR